MAPKPSASDEAAAASVGEQRAWLSRRSSTFLVLAVAGLTILVAAVFYPIVRCEFTDIDVGRQLLENPHIRGLSADNLWHIFTSRSTTSYYPVRSLTLALDYQLWGLDPAGFEFTNGLIHLANVLLLFWLILRFLSRAAAAEAAAVGRGQIAVAAFSASLFAIHPVVVEPVAWVPGREELLLTLGALGCLHFHATARHLAASGGRTRWVFAAHGAATVCCAAACLSNAVGAVIPALIVAYDLVVLRSSSLAKILKGTASLWVLAIATIVIKKIGEYLDPPAEVGMFSLDRVLLVCNVYWLNLRTLFWPMDLAIFRERVTPTGFGDTGVLLGMLAIALTLLLVWACRRRRFVLFGLLWFLIALAPYSQVMVHHIHRADRFLYLPLAGLVVAVALALRPFVGRPRERVVTAGIAAAAVVGLLVLGKLSRDQVRTWEDTVSVWENCVRVAPDNTQFRCALAERLSIRNQCERAIQEFEVILRSQPNHGPAAVKLAWLLVSCEDPEMRDPPRALELAEQAYNRDPMLFRGLADVRAKWAQHLVAADDFRWGIEMYDSALEVDPGNLSTLVPLAWLLATCSDEKLRDPQRAVELAERACLLNKEGGASQWSVLSMAYAQAGRFDMARSTAEKALRMAEAAGDQSLAAELRERLKAYHENPSNP